MVDVVGEWYVDVSLQYGTVLMPNQVLKIGSEVATKLWQGPYFTTDIILGLGEFGYKHVHLFLRFFSTGPAGGTIDFLPIKE